MSEVYEFHLLITGPEGESHFPLPQGITTIGRLPDCDLRLDHPQVSRSHARVECSAVECILTDLDSENGTFLEGTRLAAGEPAAWQPESAVQIGPFRLVLRCVPAASEPPEEEPEAVLTGQPDGDGAPGADGEEQIPPAAPAAVTQPGAAAVPEMAAVEVGPALWAAAANGAANGVSSGDPLLDLLPAESQRLVHYLPGIYDQDFMRRFLSIFESVLLPIEWQIDHFDLILDPATTPARFLAWMANWFEIARRPYWTEEQRRALIRAAPQLYARLGTAWAVRRALEIYTGQAPEIVEFADGSAPFTFTVKVQAAESGPARSAIGDLLNQLKPAHTAFVLEFAR